MFPVAVALIAFGYTTVYYAGSMSKAYKAVHKHDLAPNTKGGYPFGVLLGVVRYPMKDALIIGGAPQSFPPFVTGTAGHRPEGQ